MRRILAAMAATLFACGAASFIWKSHAEAEEIIPPAPEAAAFVAPLKAPPAAPPLAASEKSKEEKRFARADKDDVGASPAKSCSSRGASRS